MPSSPEQDGVVETRYRLACEQYAEWGVDVERALERRATVSVSLHCWQGDDVRGFEGLCGEIGGGLAVTGGYPGRARTGDELRADLDLACSLIPGRHRVNLHASYAENQGRRVDRDTLTVEGFGRWIDWARSRNMGLDFNPTFFAHPHAADGLTLSHPDPGIRRFWIDHGRACRRIGAAFGEALA
ncbi:MAG: L-rhamnose isomerase, partial [Planctomycetia bacterium]